MNEDERDALADDLIDEEQADAREGFFDREDDCDVEDFNGEQLAEGEAA